MEISQVYLDQQVTALWEWKDFLLAIEGMQQTRRSLKHLRNYIIHNTEKIQHIHP